MWNFYLLTYGWCGGGVIWNDGSKKQEWQCLLAQAILASHCSEGWGRWAYSKVRVVDCPKSFLELSRGGRIHESTIRYTMQYTMAWQPNNSGTVGEKTLSTILSRNKSSFYNMFWNIYVQEITTKKNFKEISQKTLWVMLQSTFIHIL